MATDIDYAWPIGMPICGPMGSGLFEVRFNLEAEQ